MSKKIPGEVSGTLLMGLDQSFQHLMALPTGFISLPNLDPDEWYPYSLLIGTIEKIQSYAPSDTLLFQSGVSFVRFWHDHGPGKEIVHSTLDWLHANDSSGGYNSIVRGGYPGEVGWCHLLSLDMENGVAVYENVMPLQGEFVRGVFHGGCALYDDTTYFKVYAEIQDYPEVPYFKRTVVTVQFKFKSSELTRDMHAAIQGLQLGDETQFNREEALELAWIAKGLSERDRVDHDYHLELSSLLAKSAELNLEQLEVIRKHEASLAEKVSELQVANEAIKKLSVTDALTGLPNRARIEESISYQIGIAKRSGTAFAIIMADVDRFKSVNDEHGHLSGDEVLRGISTVLEERVRDTDLCGRWGGEEFLIVCPDTDLNGALQLAEEVRSAVEAFSIPDVGSTTVSLGVTIYAENDSNESIVARADKALYQSKEAGRNSVSFA